MAIVTPDESQGQDLFEGSQNFYSHDDASDNKSGGVYSHNQYEFSATEAESWLDLIRYITKLSRYDVRNETGATIPAGSICYISGYDSTEGKLLIGLVDADTATYPPRCVTNADIADSANGVAYSRVLVTDIDTSGASAVGDIVYASNTAGEFVFSAPGTGSTWIVGTVVEVDAATGKIQFDIPGSLLNFTAGNISASSNIADNSIVRGDGGTNNIQESAVTIDDTGNILPDTDNAQALGSTAKTFSNAFFKDAEENIFTADNLIEKIYDISEEASYTKFTTAYAVASSVWTITVTDDSGTGNISVVLGGKKLVSAGSTLSVNATALAGTDANPTTVYVYIQNDGSDAPELVASNTSPDTAGITHVHVANYLAGAVSASAVTIYGDIDDLITPTKLSTNIYHRVFEAGALYRSGMAVTATSSDVTIASGTYLRIYTDVSSNSKQVSIDNLLYVKNDGTYNEAADFAFGGEYSTGESITDTKLFNVVLGIVNTGTATRILALVQRGDTIPSGSEYSNIKQAIGDKYGAVRYLPSDDLLKSLFVPVCRIIVKKSGASYALREIPESGTGIYYIDLRGTAATGSGSISTGLPDGAQGEVLYNDGTDWVTLGVGTSGQFLKTQGAGANVIWSTPAGGGDTLSAATNTDNEVAIYDGVNSKTIQGAGGTFAELSLTNNLIF